MSHMIFSGSVLSICQDRMTVNMPLYCAADYVFQSFAGDGGQRDRSIDLWLTSVAFLVYWNHIGRFPLIRYDALV